MPYPKRGRERYVNQSALWREKLAPDGMTWLIGLPVEIREMAQGQADDEYNCMEKESARRRQHYEETDDDIFSTDPQVVMRLLRQRAIEYVEDEAWAYDRIAFHQARNEVKE